jgi:hypothetical protein
VRMVPAPRGSGIVAARVPKKVLQFAGIEDVFTSSRGSTKTLGNFVKVYLFRSLCNYVLLLIICFLWYSTHYAFLVNVICASFDRFLVSITTFYGLDL